MIRRPAPALLCVSLLLVSTTGCEEEKKIPPPNPVTIVSGSAKAVCANIDRAFLLDSVEFIAEDKDGVQDIADVFVSVERSATLETESTPPLPLTAEMMAEAGGPVLRVKYSWQRQPDNNQDYFCGDGTLLEVSATVTDLDGFVARVSVAAKPL